MKRQEKFYFILYQNGCEIRMSVIGQERFLRERAFLDRLVGRTSRQASANRPIQCPTRDYDPLNDEMYIALGDRVIEAQDYFPLEVDQFDSYLTFRRKMDAEFGKP